MDTPDIAFYRYYMLGSRLVRIAYAGEEEPMYSEVVNSEAKKLEIDNNFLMKILLGDPDDLREMDEPEFAELCLQKGVKSR